MDRLRHSFNPLQRASLALLFASLAALSLLLAQQKAKADDANPKESPNDKDDPHRFDIRGMDRTELTRAFAGQLTVLPEAVAATRNEIVFIDPGVPEREKLIHSIGEKARVIELTPDRDGLSQIASALEGERNVSAVHIISHGGEARIKLVGSADVSLETLPDHLDQLSAIHNAMAPSGDVLLYGCDIAKGEDGKLFVNLLARLTGENVAASENLTGAAKRGGDWKLEYSAGSVKTQVLAPEPRENYDDVLATLTVTNNSDTGVSGDGSLRGEIMAANNGDMIVFAAGLAGQTITLATTGDTTLGPSALAISNTLTIDGSGAPGLLLSGGNTQRLFLVTGSGNLTLKNVTLTNGKALGGNGGAALAGGGGAAGLGGAILNSGTLTLSGCTLTGNTAQGGNGGNGVVVFGNYAGGGGGGLNASGGATAAYGASAGAGGGPNGGVAGLNASSGSGGAGGIGGGGGGAGSHSSGGGTGGAGGFGGGGGGAGYNNGIGGTGGFGGGGGGGSFYGSVTSAGFGGGSGRNGTFFNNGGGGGAGLGGAIFNYGGTLAISNTTLTNNSAIGGSAGTGASAGQGLGGGVFSRNGNCTILNCTVSSNSAAQGGRGVYNLGDGATATLALNNTIVGQSDTAVNDFTGTTINGGTNTTSGVGNIIRTQAGFAGTTASTADPMLSALASNGGPTQTMALNASSPARNAGNNAAATGGGLTVDQRGYTRVFNTTVDIGAFEAQVALTSLNPTTGSFGGGDPVTINGVGFTGATDVQFGAGNSAFSITVVSDIKITCVSPAGTPGATVDVLVVAPAGTSAATSADHFTYNPPPTITSISPNTGPVAGGTAVTITGVGFTGASAVKFGATNATSFTVNSDTQITASSPAGAAGTVDITVNNLVTSATSAADQFTYIAAPTTTLISPNSGPISGGTAVTLTGTGFTGATAVKFGSTNATSFTVNSATQIMATSPSGAAGAVDITVTTPGGTSATSAADQFTYAAAPAVTSVSPTSGPAAGGTAVIITGTALSGATAVKFGSTNATSFTVNSATQITATSPAGAAGAVDITVTTPGGTSITSVADNFTYTAAPVSTPLTITSNPTATPNPAFAQQTVQFSTAASGGSGTLTYAWNFGDGSSGTGSSVSHVYAAAGAYTVTLTVTDGSGNSANQSVTVTVEGSPFKLLAAHFELTPNRDSAVIKGIIHLPKGLLLSGQTINFNVGGNLVMFTLTGRTGHSGGNSVGIAAVTRADNLTIDQDAKFILRLSGKLTAALKANAPLDGAGFPTQVSVQIQFNGSALALTVPVKFIQSGRRAKANVN